MGEVADDIVIGSGILTNEYFDFPDSPRPKYVITKRPESAKISRRQHAEKITDAFSKLEEGNNN